MANPQLFARCVVWTGDRRVFFYNPTQRTSVWEMPEELVDRPDIDKLMQMPPETPRESPSLHHLLYIVGCVLFVRAWHITLGLACGLCTQFWHQLRASLSIDVLHYTKH